MHVLDSWADRHFGDSQDQKQLRQIAGALKAVCSRAGRVEDWRQDFVGLAYLFLSVSSESASIARP
jgi:hypothetical protein